MISIIIYRMFFSDGRHKGLYVLTMTAYYTMCFLLVSGPLAMLSEEEESPPLLPVAEVPLSEVTTAELRRRNVADRWALRGRLVERYCQEAGATRAHSRPGPNIRGLLISSRHKLASCAEGDTGDHFWLRTFTRLARADPSHRCGERPNDLTRCREDARRLQALKDGSSGSPLDSADWTHVVTVSHPYSRLAAAYLRKPFPTATSTFPEAVHALNSGDAGLPEGLGPLTVTCDLCGVIGRRLIVQKETEDEELEELGRQWGISDYLRRPAPNPRSPAARAAAAGPSPSTVSQLLGQLSADQLRQLQRLYRADFEALSFYDPAEFQGSAASPPDYKEPVRIPVQELTRKTSQSKDPEGL
ncbi:uncharacterized protein LOC122368208 [Amphibalanus amphitrite]|uniref:uncharacterized protein LOC122368208 n=1 Tax=Amphibalanus amphitrite TaxID=1232801 RepID=UPI001C908142|nr:uncharacterized protein LOC122368208 [Amphibalanus amphitrite]